MAHPRAARSESNTGCGARRVPGVPQFGIGRARGCIVWTAALFLSAGVLTPAVAAQVSPSWQPIPGGGCMMRLAGGDSSAKADLVAYRVRFPADYQRDSGVHYHLDTRHIVVLAGTIIIGFGDTVDVRKTKAYGPGGFIVIPAGAHHFEWWQGAMEAHVESVGPDQTVWVTHAANYAKRTSASGTTPSAAGC
jgi:mannose-6-phosphate isomerase-like protein (cupin superfamily)